MKKKGIVLLALLGSFLITNASINAACKDPGQNYSNSTKSIYNCETKELLIYGQNSSGNLGAGHNKAVVESNAIKVNSKIGNKKIIDYFISSGTTYVLTEDNKVYTSGNGVADGLKGKRNTFINVVLYKGNKNKVTYLNGAMRVNTDKDGNYDDDYTLYFKTKDKRNFYQYDDAYIYKKQKKNMSKKNKISSSSISDGFYKDEYKDARYKVISISKKANGDKYEVIADRNNRIILSEYYNKKKRTTLSKKNVNGVIVYSEYSNSDYSYSAYKEYRKGKLYCLDVIKDVENGYKITSIYYKNNKKTFKDASVYRYYDEEYNDYELSNKKYYYKNNKLTQRKVYYANKKRKLKLSNKKWYKYRKSGKNYNYITYYKNGKAKNTYKYELNKKGKVISKKHVKLRK